MGADETARIEQLTRQVERLLAEMADLRRQVAALSQNATPSARVAGQGERSGLRASQDEPAGRFTREWLDVMFAQQWQRAR